MNRPITPRHDEQIRVARTSDLDAVVSVLDDAAAWLAERAIVQWPSRFDPDVIRSAIVAGQTWVAIRHGQCLGTMTLTLDDPAWDDAGQDNALYVHRLAVRRPAAGLGSTLLQHAADHAAALDRVALRLDFVSSNDALRRYYAAHGFKPHGRTTVRGSPGQRRRDGPPVTIDLMQRATHPAGPARPHDHAQSG